MVSVSRLMEQQRQRVPYTKLSQDFTEVVGKALDSQAIRLVG